MKTYKVNLEEKNRVLAALQALCPIFPSHEFLPAHEIWPKTRHIADYCNINIYISRYYLMKLVEENKAQVSPTSINNSLRWYIAESPATPETPTLPGSTFSSGISPDDQINLISQETT